MQPTLWPQHDTPYRRWLRGQRISLLAFRIGLPLEVLETLPPEERDTWPYRERLGAELALANEAEKETALHLHNQQVVLSTLSPGALNTLLAIPQENLGRKLRALRPNWQQARSRLLDGNGTWPGLMERAARVVDMLLYGNITTNGLLRYGRTHYNKFWSFPRFTLYRETGVVTALDQLRNQLHTPTTSLQSRLDSIQNFRDVLKIARREHSQLLAGWTQIENTLFDHLCSWPLLVPEDINLGIRGYSLPVSIEVYFDDAGHNSNKIIHNADKYTMYFEGSKKEGEFEEGLQRYERRLRRCMHATKDLWEREHRHCGSFVDRVRGASIIVDFKAAADVLKNLGIRFGMAGPSMEAYFAASIMGRLCGHPILPANLATGGVGSRDQGRYPVTAAGGIEGKLLYAFSMHSFHRVILPQSLSGPAAEDLAEFFAERSSDQNLDIVYARSLVEVIDAFDLGNWRRNSYVRCPDVEWAFGSGVLPASRNPEVHSCLELLAGNKHSVLECRGVKTIVLAAALRAINTALRPSGSPMNSIAFVRADAEEGFGGRFWDTILALVGAPVETRKRFQLCDTPLRAAVLLARTLNDYTPSVLAPGRRVPDILVILGTDCWREKMTTIANLSSNPLLFSAVIDELKKLSVEPVHHPGMVVRLGATRIVVLPDSDALDEAEHFAMNEEVRAADDIAMDNLLVDRLSIFRYGFNQRMVTPILWEFGYPHDKVRLKLRELVAHGRLRYSSGNYHVSGQVGNPHIPDAPPQDQAKWHCDACLALAPYLDSRAIPKASPYLVFRPDIIHEAQYHVRRAYEIAERSRISAGFRALVSSLQYQLLNFYQVQSWNVLSAPRFGRATAEAYALARELIEDSNLFGYDINAGRWCDAANAARVVYEELGKQIQTEQRRRTSFSGTVENIQSQRDAIWSDACLYFDNAFRTSSEVIGNDVVNRVRVLTHYSDFLLNNPTKGELAQRLEKMNSEAWQLLDCDEEIPTASGSGLNIWEIVNPNMS